MPDMEHINNMALTCNCVYCHEMHVFMLFNTRGQSNCHPTQPAASYVCNVMCVWRQLEQTMKQSDLVGRLQYKFVHLYFSMDTLLIISNSMQRSLEGMVAGAIVLAFGWADV